ncbi:MAG: Cupin 4 [Myxococcales bacterium]|nr:Cupin 4 [Myxococcales bacterium]
MCLHGPSLFGTSGSVLRDWIAPLALEGFLEGYLHRSAWAQPASATAAIPLLDWEILGRVLAATNPPPDVIVCAQGKKLDLPPPRDLTEMRAYLRIGVGLCMRHTQRCDAILGRVAAGFERDLPGSVQVQIFVTPGGTHGFGWHYDIEDVFIAQTVGIKDYYFRENTVEKLAPFPPRDFFGFQAETAPLQTATLVPGDFLYIPSKWWHMAVCREDALSISVGVVPGANVAPHPKA